MKHEEPSVTGMDMVDAAGHYPDPPSGQGPHPPAAWSVGSWWLTADSFSGNFPPSTRGNCFTWDNPPSHRQLTSNDWSIDGYKDQAPFSLFGTPITILIPSTLLNKLPASKAPSQSLFVKKSDIKQESKIQKPWRWELNTDMTGCKVHILFIISSHLP